MYMRGSSKFCQRGSNSEVIFFYLVDEGRAEDLNNTKSRLDIKSAHQRNAILWPFASGTMIAGLIALSFPRRSGPVLI